MFKKTVVNLIYRDIYCYFMGCIFRTNERNKSLARKQITPLEDHHGVNFKIVHFNAYSQKTDHGQNVPCFQKPLK